MTKKERVQGVKDSEKQRIQGVKDSRVRVEKAEDRIQKSEVRGRLEGLLNIYTSKHLTF